MDIGVQLLERNIRLSLSQSLDTRFKSKRLYEEIIRETECDADEMAETIMQAFLVALFVWIWREGSGMKKNEVLLLTD